MRRIVAGPDPDLRPPPFPHTEKAVIIILCLWALLVYGAGEAGWLALLPGPVFGALAGALTVLLIGVYFTVRPFRLYMQSFTLAQLTLLHIWRIAAAALYLSYGAQELLPDVFVTRAGYGDLLAGCMVPFVLLLRRYAASFWVFNVIGFADFMLVVGTGFALAALGNELMLNIRVLPLAMIPLFGAPLSGLTHIVMFHKLMPGRSRRGRTTDIQI